MKLSKTILTGVFLAFALSATPGRAQTDYSTDAPEDVNYFYGDLSPYGQWVDLEGYGWCWQPSVVATNPGWQPYCDDGHWVYTDAGWFWQSDYDWGWAPFHYGRWLRHQNAGWVWFPDRVWGPAWVTWRTGGNDCGWAPLPLHAVFDANAGFLYNGVRVGANFDFGLPANCFTFVALGDFCAPDLGHHRLGQPDVDRIYAHTSIINDYRFVDKTVVNRGIPVERVAAVTHANLRPIAIRDEPAGGGEHGPGNGAVAAVYRRTPRMPDKPVEVRAVKVDEQHPIVQHGPMLPASDEHRNMAPNEPVRPVEAPPKQTVERAPQPKPDAGQPVEIIGPEPEWKEPPAPPGSLATHTPRSQQVADQAHALPPLFKPHDAPPPPEPPAKPIPHVPRSQAVANQAHALPPLAEKPPPVELAKPGNSHPDAVASPRDNEQQKH
ncbi:MAG TPA: DUF6600 domain-containing protein [Verrucomicrobiae bacterium]|nr:DUF6600 domain-containing protein [Verrucomicrobiae bacterium]